MSTALVTVVSRDRSRRVDGDAVGEGSVRDIERGDGAVPSTQETVSPKNSRGIVSKVVSRNHARRVDAQWVGEFDRARSIECRDFV